MVEMLGAALFLHMPERLFDKKASLFNYHVLTAFIGSQMDKFLRETEKGSTNIFITYLLLSIFHVAPMKTLVAHSISRTLFLPQTPSAINPHISEKASTLHSFLISVIIVRTLDKAT